MKQSFINFGLIGCGRISQTYLQAMEKVSGCRLIAVADTLEEAAHNIARQNGCKAYVDYRRILDENPIHAVIVCTPPNTHGEISTFFLRNRIHVLCEKPLSLTIQEVAEMEKVAEEQKCVLMMASKYRYVEDVIQAKKIVESGILGEIILYENVFCSKVDMEQRWNSRKAVAGGGVLIDNGCHSVDIARYLLGPIEKIQAEAGKRIQRIEVEDTARVYFRTTGNVLGTIDLSWSIGKDRESYIDIYGTEGVLSIGWKCSKLHQNGKENWQTFGKGYNKLEAFSRQISNFIGTIRGTERPLINSRDAWESVKAILAAYKSIAMNKWVDVE